MAFFPAGVTYPSMLGEMYSAAFNAPAFNWLNSPACTELETVVLDWLARALGLPETYLSTSSQGGGGVIQGSASEAIVTCMVAARERYLHAKCDAEGLEPNSSQRDERIAQLRGKLVSLSSDQTHSSAQKGARIAGTLHKPITTSYANNLSLTGSDVEKALEECTAAGQEPYFLALTLGTTSTCSVDDFASIIPIISKHPNLWVHVDAAYAGAALILPEYSARYSHYFDKFTSFNFNMHKWLLVNFDASCLYVQDRRHLTRALSIEAAYYVNKHSDSGLVTDYRDWQIPLGRRFRALKIWFVMRSYGIEGMQEHIRRTIRLGETFASWVRDADDLFEIVAKPAFALTCFRISPSAFISPGANGAPNGLIASGTATPTPANAVDPAFEPPASISKTKESLQRTANILTQKVVDAITERGTIFLTGSSAGGKTFVRVVSANPNAEEKYVRMAWEEIVEVSQDVLRQWQDGTLRV
jgi:aromatic-L-amino-acid/L-tryptophan decarboxylase